MGFRFRRSIKLLPGVRVNLSGGGASVSVGPRGFHYTVGPKGTRVTAGIPGTGLSWSEYTPHARSRPNAPRIPEPSFQVESPPSVVEPIDPALTVIENAPAEEINAFSASELAPILNSAHRKLRFAPLVQLVSILVFVAALLHANQLSLGLSALYATVFVPIAIFLDRYRRSVKIVYEPHGATGQIAQALADSFGDLTACASIWRIRAEGGTADWKRNAGATTLNQRKKMKVQFDKPDCIRGNSQFPCLKIGSDEIYLLPDAALIIVKGSVAAVHYQDLEVSNSQTRFIEEEKVPTDSPVVGQTWRYVNKKGGPDRRFNSNKQLPICVYGEISFRSEGGLNCKIHCSNPAAPDRLSNVIEVLHRSNAALPKAITYVKTAKSWPSVIFLVCAVAFGAGQLAFFPGELIYANFQKNVPPSNGSDRNQLTTPVQPQPIAVLPANLQERESAWESRIAAPAAPQNAGQGPKIASQTDILPTKPPAHDVPLPRPRPKF
jgi:hypothetical protein